MESLLLLIGVVAFGVWVWSAASLAVFQDWDTWVFDREFRGEPATVFGYLAEKKERIIGDVRTFLGIQETPKPSPPRPKTAPATRPPPAIGKDSLIGRLVIPRLHLRAIVREGDGEQTLRWALGHIPSTALPGQDGNVGVAGHRDTLFRGLRKIAKADLILFETLAGTYVYQVDATEIVRPQNLSVLNTRQYPELTLVTCYPFYYIGSAPERFIVKARLVSANGPQETASRANAGEPVAKDRGGSPPTSRDSGPIHAFQASGGHKGLERKPGISRVIFEVAKGHSKQLSPGISLGLTRTDVTDHRASGWVWLMPDRRTIWLRNQTAQHPLIFYGYQDGKQRELVITSVTENSVTGYLLLSEYRARAIPATREHQE